MKKLILVLSCLLFCSIIYSGAGGGFSPPGGGGWVGTATSDLDMDNYPITNVSTITITGSAKIGSNVITQSSITTPAINLNGSDVDTKFNSKLSSSTYGGTKAWKVDLTTSGINCSIEFTGEGDGVPRIKLFTTANDGTPYGFYNAGTGIGLYQPDIGEDVAIFSTTTLVIFRNITPEKEFQTIINLGSAESYFDYLHIGTITYHSMGKYKPDVSVSVDIMKIDLSKPKSQLPKSIYVPKGKDRIVTKRNFKTGKLETKIYPSHEGQNLNAIISLLIEHNQDLERRIKVLEVK